MVLEIKQHQINKAVTICETLDAEGLYEFMMELFNVIPEGSMDRFLDAIEFINQIADK